MITSIHAAMAKKREDVENDEQGFTLIELLVVILIIGILSAIAIPVFLGQQNQAKDAAAKSDLANAKVAIISAATAANGVYPTTTTDLEKHGYVKSDGVGALSIIAASATKLCLSAKSATGTEFYITHDKGASETACTA